MGGSAVKRGLASKVGAGERPVAAPFTGDPVTLQGFTAELLAALGARVEPVGDDVRVELSSAQLAALEDLPQWSFPPSVLPGPDALVVLRFTFDPRRSGGEAELISPGSERMAGMIRAALGNGRLGRAWLRAGGLEPERDRPYLVFHFLVTYVGHQSRERVLSAAVDLVAAEALVLTEPVGDPWLLKPKGDGTPADPPRLTLGEAHTLALDALGRAIGQSDGQWLADAREWFEGELETLRHYRYAAHEDEEDDSLAAACAVRLRELAALARPHVRVRAEAATLIYMPLVRRFVGRKASWYNPFLNCAVPGAPARAASGPGGPRQLAPKPSAR